MTAHPLSPDQDRALAALVRAARFDEADALVGVATLPHVAVITGWETLQQLIFRPMHTTKRLCAAVALVAATHEPTAGDAESSPAPGAVPLEVELHGEQAFPFAAVTPDDVATEDALHAPRWRNGFETLPGARLAVAGLSEIAPDDRVAQWRRTIAFHRAVRQALEEEGLARRLPVLVQVRRYVQGHGMWSPAPGDADGPFLTALRIPARSRERAEDAIARMVAARDEEQREFRRRHRLELLEGADVMRALRRALRASRFWPFSKSPKTHALRELYASKEALVFQAQSAEPPRPPSWTTSDDGEFERFLQRHYVDAFLH
ncbi:hypothetical protein [Roseisolibacter agri]|uniref:Uncharacterized protein n=1 Tax=Roseisolibacter agri TaxID=2014610 RepID=A0AA37Q7G9_9BACT|nr:hypothetical protein [Roseisolibacter agri]GLC27654.1 hypothetical protein rosag_41670 [Roseisolibacter agri]